MKKIYHLIVIIALLFMSSSNVSAKADNNMISINNQITDTYITGNYVRLEDIETIELSNICQEKRIQNTFKFLGIALRAIKVVVPAILIIFGTIDFFKAFTSSNSDALGKAGKMFVIRIIAGVVIFVLPTIINFAFSLAGADNSNYAICRNCLFKPNTCGYDPSNGNPIKGGQNNANEAVK